VQALWQRETHRSAFIRPFSGDTTIDCNPTSDFPENEIRAWLRWTLDIFEGTEQIQQLVVARAISGLRIE
jgi:hypothetical protein